LPLAVAWQSAHTERMPRDEDKSTIGERLTGIRDPKDPDGLLTVEQAENPPDPTAFGTEETDTLEREREWKQERERRKKTGDAPTRGGHD
jgi:hypothetical protein